MKKIVFTAQIFGLIAAFPLYIISELNHVPAQPLPAAAAAVAAVKIKPAVSNPVTNFTAEFDGPFLFILTN